MTGASVERSYRGISRRLAVHYLRHLGGERVDEDRVVGDGWEVRLSESTVRVGPSLTLTEVVASFEGDPETVESVVERFSQKAMRAGG